MIDKIKTFWINRKFLKDLFSKELHRLNAERKMAEYLKKKEYLTKHNCFSEESFLNYMQHCKGDGGLGNRIKERLAEIKNNTIVK